MFFRKSRLEHSQIMKQQSRKGDRNGKGIFYERNFTGEGT